MFFESDRVICVCLIVDWQTASRHRWGSMCRSYKKEKEDPLLFLCTLSADWPSQHLQHCQHKWKKLTAGGWLLTSAWLLHFSIAMSLRCLNTYTSVQPQDSSLCHSSAWSALRHSLVHYQSNPINTTKSLLSFEAPSHTAGTTNMLVQNFNLFVFKMHKPARRAVKSSSPLAPHKSKSTATLGPMCLKPWPDFSRSNSVRHWGGDCKLDWSTFAASGGWTGFKRKQINEA